MNPTIRAERVGDFTAIAQVTEEAFRPRSSGSRAEPFIIEALRTSDALTVSLVAEVDTAVVGHVAFSPVCISDGSPNWFGLGPLSVSPQFQRQGVGQALIRAGLVAIKTLGAEGCVVLGDPAYYRRFGFQSRADLMLGGVPFSHFQVISFGGRLATGNVSYHSAFEAKAPSASP